MAPRKTLATPITLAALAALIFTGCGEQKTGSIPEPSTSSSSAASSSSGLATASESGDAAEHYSGGSKAPEGEYRPADEQGPAQNVPKPVKPEGMNVESAEGLEKFLGYWKDSVNYGMQTGDFSYAKPLISEDYAGDAEVYAWATELYDRGGWLVGGLREVKLGANLLTSHGEGRYTWVGLLPTSSTYSYIDDAKDYLDNSWTTEQPVEFQVHYTNGAWKVDGVASVEGQ